MPECSFAVEKEEARDARDCGEQAKKRRRVDDDLEDLLMRSLASLPVEPRVSTEIRKVVAVR